MQKLKSMQFNALARTPHTFHYTAHLNQLDFHSHLLSSYPQTDTIIELTHKSVSQVDQIDLMDSINLHPKTLPKTYFPPQC